MKQVDRFVFLDNKRKINKKQTISLFKCIMRGKHWDSPIVVNRVEDKFHVLEHRKMIGIMKKKLKLKIYMEDW